MGKFNEELVKAGVMLAGRRPEAEQQGQAGAASRAGRRPSSTARSPRPRSSSPASGSGRSSRIDEAVEWVRRCPDPMPGEESEIEIRPFFEAEDFGKEFTAGAARPESSAHRGERGRPSARRRERPRRAGHRGGLAHRVRPADRRARARGPRRRPRRGPRPGRAGHRARALAGDGHPRQPGRVAHGDGQEPRHRSAAPAADAGAQARRARGRGVGLVRRRRPTSRPRSTRTSATTCCGSSSSPATRCSRPRRGWRSPCGSSAG